jgi:hypothetical protein
MRLRTAVFAALLLMSCARTKDTNTFQADEDKSALIPDTSAVPVNGLYILENYLTSHVADTSELEIVDYDCAVVVDPTEEQIRTMRAEYGEEDFYIVADDNSWYKGNAIELLDSLKIHSITADKPFISFHGQQGQWTLNLRKPGALPWNLIFFHTQKKPEIVSTVDLKPSDISAYFN